jgi:4-diphosphocytidyl-2-C-methyl-D-erythritol kinase
MAEAPAAGTWMAPAKINLFLYVTGRRPDGYHLLDSLVVFADVGDIVTVAPADRLTLSLCGPFADGVPADSGNLVMQAAQRLSERCGIGAGAAIALRKNLPVAAGLGGGSSDAAACLLALCDLWGMPCEGDMLAELALDLGADVPACLQGRPVRLRGIGEILAVAEDVPPLPAVLVNPGVPLATPDVFRRFGGGFSGTPPAWPAVASVAQFVEYLAGQRNDLEAAAIGIAPAIGEVIAQLAASEGCLLARMSGSGATCFGIFADPVAARFVASRLADARPEWWVCPTMLGGSPLS